MFCAEKFENVSITGEGDPWEGGSVIGQGHVWWQDRDGFRPRTVYFHGFIHVLIGSVTLQDLPEHCLEMCTERSSGSTT